MVRAVTGIDDDLISDAHNVQKSKIVPWKRLGALAASLVLIVSAAFLLKPDGRTVIRVSGQKLTVQPVTVEPENQPAAIRAYSLTPLITVTVPLEIEVKGHTVISVSNGNLQVYDSEGDSLLYEGKTYSTEENVKIFWTMETDGTATRFEMSVESGKTADIVILMYDDGGWKISKIKK